MAFDRTAIAAVLLKEDGFELPLDALLKANMAVVGMPTMLETAMVLTSRLKTDARPLVQEFLRRMNADPIPFEEAHLNVAIDAFLRFGRGRHPAALNFGDCMSYAISAVAGMPLLFTGDDFPRTDVEPVLLIPTAVALRPLPAR